MNKHPLRWSLLVAVILLLAACQDRRDPVKPIAAQPAPVHATA